MKRIILVAAFILVLFVFNGDLSAQRSGTGIGIILAEPTGLSLKAWMSSRSALVLGAAWSLDTDTWHMHADLVRHSFNLVRVDRTSLAFYYGVGGRMTKDKKTRAGIRIPLGINYFFKKVPLDLFFEFVPVFDVIPDTNLRFQGGFGLRYFF